MGSQPVSKYKNYMLVSFGNPVKILAASRLSC